MLASLAAPTPGSWSPRPQLPSQALLTKDVELTAFAQGALVSYVRSVYLQPLKVRTPCLAGAVSGFGL